MALTQRLYRLFQADLHGILDRLEEPDMVLKQALREMEEELEHAEQTLQRLERDKNDIARRQRELLALQARAEQELELCFQADNEALARTVLKRKLEMAKLSQHLARRCEELEAASCERRVQLVLNRDHYHGVRQKAELLAQESQLDDEWEEGACHWRAREFCVRSEEVDIALMQEKHRRAMPGRDPA